VTLTFDLMEWKSFQETLQDQQDASRSYRVCPVWRQQLILYLSHRKSYNVEKTRRSYCSEASTLLLNQKWQSIAYQDARSSHCTNKKV